jgi:hypothetical protein
MTCQVQGCGYWQRKRIRSSADGRRLARIRWSREKAERIANPPDIDADTARMRALHDAKGKLVLAGISPTLGRVEIYRSTARHDQLDVFVNGDKVSTGGARVLAQWLKTLPITNEPNETSCPRQNH